MNKTVCCVSLVIQELQLILSFFQTEQLAVDIDKLRRYPVHRLGDPVAVSVIGVGIAAFTVGHARQPAPCCPGEGFADAINQWDAVLSRRIILPNYLLNHFHRAVPENG